MDPLKRPTAKMIQEHQWVQSHVNKKDLTSNHMPHKTFYPNDDLETVFQDSENHLDKLYRKCLESKCTVKLQTISENKIKRQHPEEKRANFEFDSNPALYDKLCRECIEKQCFIKLDRLSPEEELMC